MLCMKVMSISFVNLDVYQCDLIKLCIVILHKPRFLLFVYEL